MIVTMDITPTSPQATFADRFAGKTMLITGGARGIGRATALRAAREGANVVIADVLAEPGEATAASIREAGGNAIFVQTDVGVDAECARAVEATVEHFGGLHLAVNAAGVMDGVPPGDDFDLARDRDLLFAPIHEATDVYWERCFAANTTGMFYSMRHELRALLAAGAGGAIVNIGSIAGKIGLGGNPAYVASKHAVTGLTRNAAIDYAGYGIRVNSVNMAGTDTPMTEAAYAKVSQLRAERTSDDPGQGTAFAKSLSLLGIVDSNHRMATADEQASVILFLLSDDASNMTGATWATDGGWTTF